MKRKFTFSAICVVLLTLSAAAQENVVKLNLGALLWRKISFNYERVVNENQTFSIYLDYRIPVSRKISYFETDEGTKGEGDGKFKISGFNISPEYRFYTSSSKDVPRGFYVAPYLRYSHTKYRMEGNITTTETDGTTSQYNGEVSAFLNRFGCGAQMGYQWLINDKLSIDFAFFGLGIDRYMVGADIKPYDGSTDLDEMAQDIENELGDIPYFGKKLKTEVRDDKVRVKAPFLLPGLRGTLSIGYAF